MSEQLTPELIEQATAQLTIDQLAKAVTDICKRNGYQIVPVAIGKRSGQPAPEIDVVADTHRLDLAFVELPKP